ncbi:MAG: GGDEF domain-containing protein [Butyrivibrio sp.]|nr:GGDEF domain-containing protein [Butyrivibrio sp.]
MKTRNSLAQKIYTLLFASTVILFVVFVMTTTEVFYPGYQAHYRLFNADWTDDSGEKCLMDDARPRNYGGVVTLTKKLPGNLSDDDSLCFESRNAILHIWVDNEEIYEFTPEQNLTGMGYGVQFHEIGLKKEYGGHNVRIRISGVLPGYGRVMGMSLCPVADYIQMNIMRRAFPTMLSFFIGFFGVIMCIFYLIIPDKSNMPFDIMSLGIASILIGIWLLLDSNITQLLSGNIYSRRVLDKTIILMVLYPLVCFFVSLTRQKRVGYIHAAFWCNVAILVVLFFTRFVIGLDMIITFIFAVCALILGVVLFMSVIFIDNAIYCRANNMTAGLRVYYLGMFILVLSATVDLVIYVINNRRGESYGLFTRVGMTIFVVFFLLQFLSWWTRDRADIKRDRFINRALQYAVSSGSSEDGIRSILEYMGNELHAKRICIFEEHGNDRFHGTYEWFPEGGESADTDMLYLPYEGFIDELYTAYNANNQRLIINNIEEYKTVHPTLYSMLRSKEVENLVAGSLETKGRLLGFLFFLNVPGGMLEEAAEITALLSYFLTQLIVQREEQKRLRFFSYNDSLSGALNRRAFSEYVDSGLDKSNAFGCVLCSIIGLESTNSKFGYEAGDKMVVDLVSCLSGVFGTGNVYRLSGAEFAAFGFESDESFFDGDVERVRRMIREKDMEVAFGAVYCAYGTMDISIVLRRAGEQMREEIS